VLVSNRQGWSKAYNFNLDEDITITQAMKLRRGKDPRAGDLHCHRDCFFAGTGDRLLTRKEAYDGSRKAHFAKWPSESVNPRVNTTSCSRFSHASSRRETMDYANYYFQFEEYLNGLIGNGEPYFVSSVERGDEIGEPDFYLTHDDNDWSLSRTYVTIIDENKRRNRRLIPLNRSSVIDGRSINIVIIISEYTVAQLDDFERGGIGKFEQFWQKSIQRINNEITRIKNAEIAEAARIEQQKRALERSKERVKLESIEVQEKIDEIKFDEFLPPNINGPLEELRSQISKVEKAEENEGMTPSIFNSFVRTISKLQSIYFPLREIWPREVKLWRLIGEYDWLVANFGLDFFHSNFEVPENFEIVQGREVWLADFHIRSDWVDHHGNKVFVISDLHEKLKLSYFMIRELWYNNKQLLMMKNVFVFNQKHKNRHGPWRKEHNSEEICTAILNVHNGKWRLSYPKTDLVNYCRIKGIPVSGTKAELCIRIVENEIKNLEIPKYDEPGYLKDYLDSKKVYDSNKFVP
tara:strand:+ start:914 stop:2476 length:1563 start_codon:yes stop_codon:yes gene_type:complete